MTGPFDKTRRLWGSQVIRTGAPATPGRMSSHVIFEEVWLTQSNFPVAGTRQISTMTVSGPSCKSARTQRQLVTGKAVIASSNGMAMTAALPRAYGTNGTAVMTGKITDRNARARYCYFQLLSVGGNAVMTQPKNGPKAQATSQKAPMRSARLPSIGTRV